MKELTRNLLIQLFEELKVPFNEGESSIENLKHEERIVFWDYIWEDIHSSNLSYASLVTYQVSFFSIYPPRENQKLLELRNKLRKFNIRPIISHEYVIDKKLFHSYFKLEVDEDGF